MRVTLLKIAHALSQKKNSEKPKKVQLCNFGPETHDYRGSPELHPSAISVQFCNYSILKPSGSSQKRRVLDLRVWLQDSAPRDLRR